MKIGAYHLCRLYLLLVSLEAAVMRKVIDWRSMGIGSPKTEERIRAKAFRITRNKPQLATNGLPEILFFRDKMDILFEQIERQNMRDIANELRSKYKALNINDIRNQIAHPQYDIWEQDLTPFYDRVNNFISLNEFSECGIDVTDIKKKILELSEEETVNDASKLLALESPYRAVDLIPNNLPRPFDFNASGLIGRTDDLVELHKNWKRNLAIIASGGIGKTSVALEFLSQLSNDTTAEDELDAIVFISFKTEILGISGISKARNKPSKDEMFEEIFYKVRQVLGGNVQDFELHEKKILLCLDNLEEIVLDYEDDFIEELIATIPENWHFLITSRIRVIGSKNVNLECMSDDSLSILCDSYLCQFNVDASIGIKNRLIITSKGNPLFLWFATLLYYKGGKEWPDAIAEAEEGVLGFSFRYLLPNLNNCELNALCALTFFQSPATRYQLAKVSGIDAKELPPTIAGLAKSGLIDRTEGDIGTDELIAIKDRFRDVVALSESLHVIKMATERRYTIFKNSKDVRKELFSTNRFAKNYISHAATDDLARLISDTYFNPDLNEVAKLFQLRKFSSQFGDCADYHYYLGRILSGEMAVTELLRSHELDPTHYYSLLRVADEIKLNDPERALHYMQPLIDGNLHIAENSSLVFANKLLTCYSHSLVKSKRYTEAMEFTRDKDKICIGYIPEARLLRLRIMIRVAQSIEKSQLTIELINSLFTAIQDIYDVFGMTSNINYDTDWDDSRSEFANRAVKELINLIPNSRHRLPDSVITLLKDETSKLNNFIQSARKDSPQYLTVESLTEKGFERFIVKTIDLSKGFGFAYTLSETSKNIYFNTKAMMPDSRTKWHEISVGDEIYCLISSEKKKDRLRSASSFVAL
ncbi:hypothetical protein [Propionivibrio sp.]|uniref:hypothetical protein n=1 Tax=Propionivibrio sp. TaxID=2212460 RepID=UPI003BF147BB